MDRDAEIRPISDVEEGAAPAGEKKGENKAFFTSIAEVKRTLGELETKVGPTAEETKALRAGQAYDQLDEPRSLAVIFEDQLTFDEQKKREEIEERTGEIRTLIKQAKLKLEELDADAKDATKKYSVADRKMRTNMHTTLAKRTEVLAGRFLELKQMHSKQNEETMQRQVKLTTMDETGKSVSKETGKEYTEEELELMAAQCLESGTSPFMAGLAQTALEDVLRKHEAIVQIERSIEEVAQLFQDLAILVTGAYAAAKKGVVELQKANDHARKNRKRMCCLWLCLVIVLVAILFPMLGSWIFGL